MKTSKGSRRSLRTLRSDVAFFSGSSFSAPVKKTIHRRNRGRPLSETLRFSAISVSFYGKNVRFFSRFSVREASFSNGSDVAVGVLHGIEQDTLRTADGADGLQASLANAVVDSST